MKKRTRMSLQCQEKSITHSSWCRRDAVAAAIEQCVAKKVRTATIYSDGFAETGEEGRRMQEEVLAIAKAGGVRVLGPNCIGILSIRAIARVIGKRGIGDGPH